MTLQREPLLLSGVPQGAISAAMFGFFALAISLTLVAPLGLWVLLAATVLMAAGMLVYECPVAASIGWLLVIGSTPEYWLGDLAGGASLIIAAEKLAGLALVAACLFRYGARLDLFNPGLAFAAMFLIGVQHGLHPRLEAAESVRSLAGSVAPFAFSWSRLSRSWTGAVIRVTCWLPSALVALGAGLAAAGLHPLFVDQLGFRLQATGIPAFLGGFAATGVYACLLELLRGGRRIDLALLATNFLILVLSGARTPLAVCLAVVAITVLCLPARRFSAARRTPFVLLGVLALPVLVAVASQLSSVRLFNMLSGKAESMSGRDLLWPMFQQAWESAPWLGWGVGAGKAVIPPDSPVAHLTGTIAPHNEYLRIGAEGGYVGLGLLVGLMFLWTVSHTRQLARTDRFIMRLIMAGIAVHAATDNLLISTTSSVLFAWVSAVFARGAHEREAAGSQVQACSPANGVASYGAACP